MQLFVARYNLLLFKKVNIFHSCAGRKGQSCQLCLLFVCGERLCCNDFTTCCVLLDLSLVHGVMVKGHVNGRSLCFVSANQ